MFLLGCSIREHAIDFPSTQDKGEEKRGAEKGGEDKIGEEERGRGAGNRRKKRRNK